MDIYRVIYCKVIHAKVARTMGGLPMNIDRVHILQKFIHAKVARAMGGLPMDIMQHCSNACHQN